MFDTVHLKINNLKVHDSVYRTLLNSKQQFSKLSADEHRDGSYSPLRADKQGKVKRVIATQLQREIIFKASGKAIENFRYVSHNVTSSHYTIMISVDPVNDCITFNFSIPKYFYGTNIIQAVDHYTDKDYIGGSPADLWDIKGQQAYIKIRRFIKVFFAREFPVSSIDYRFVELKRIDMCFNLIFPTKDLALSYLDMQKKIRKKNQRKTTDVMDNHLTSFFIHNSDYSFKVYHKGTEYETVGDRSKHEAVNKPYEAYNNKLGKVDEDGYFESKKQKRNPPFNVHDLQNFADRVLRFEMTFRATYISKLFNQCMRLEKNWMGKRDNPVYAKLKSFYYKIQALKQKTVWIVGEDGKEREVEIDYYKSELDPKTKKTIYINFHYLEDIIERLRKVHLFNKDKTSYFSYIEQNFIDIKSRGIKPLTRYQCIYMLFNFYRQFDRFLSKTYPVVLKMDADKKQEYDTWRYDTVSLLSLPTLLLDSKMMDIIQKKFWSTCKEFELQSLPSLEVFKHSMAAYNSSQSKPTNRVDEAKMTLIYLLIERNFQLHSIKELLNLPDPTYYRYKKFFKKIGIVQASDKGFYKPFYDFSTYYLEVNQIKYRYLFASAYKF